MKNNTKSRDIKRAFFSTAAVCAVLALAACASDNEVATDVAAPAPAAEPATVPAPMTTSSFGAAPAPRFVVPSAADQSPPNVNTVPTTAPTPNSTAEERDRARRGLIADLANARHSDLGGRTQPVTVRPYVASAAGQPADPVADEAPPAPDTTRLDAPPPVRPPEAGGAPAKPAAGPAPANSIPTGS